MGMGGAMAATADDFAASYYNPAGNAFQNKPNFGLGYLITGSSFTGYGIEAPELDETRGLIFGTTLPLPFGSFLKDRVSFGLAIFLPDGVLLGIKVPDPTDPQYVILQNSGRSVTLIPTLGVKLHRGIAFGGGVQLFDNTSGELKGTVEPDGTIQATVGQELPTKFAPTCGLLFHPEEYWLALRGWRFGLVFRESFFTRYEIPVYTSIAQVPLSVSFEAVSLYMPRQWIAGLAFAWKRWLWEINASYNTWSDFPDPNLDIDVELEIPILPISFRDSEDYPTNFHDTLTARFGTEVLTYDGRDLKFLLRGGYAFDPSPAPAQRRLTNYLDTDRHIGAVSGGLEWHGIGDYRFDVPFVFDVVFQAQYLPKRTSYKNDGISADNPGYPSLGFAGYLYAVGVTFSTKFDYE